MKKQIIAIDAGNTALKVGVFENDELISVCRQTMQTLHAYIDEITVGDFEVVISSVLNEADLKELRSFFTSSVLVTSTTPSPCPTHYKSIETLGVDRYCNAVYAYSKTKTENAIVIDIGTCIKFDVVSRKTGYLGGSIAPGADLRFRSMNDYTGNLPLLSNKSEIDTVGSTTEESMRSGVINGISAEINGLMNTYRSKYADLTFFVTGGDAHFFDIEAKNDIFADENLTLIGLYEVYKYNA